MKWSPVTLLHVWYEPEEGRRVKVGRIATKERQTLFEYDAEFVDAGFELSPFKLPLQRGVSIGTWEPFEGLFGLFDDSLPDGWGRLLMDRRAIKAGFEPGRLRPLDRLSLIGARAMGALVYEPQVELEPPTVVKLPEIAADAARVLRDARVDDLDRLIALGGSPQGARPKVLVQLANDGSVVYGSRTAVAGASYWMVKFRGRGDDVHVGALEHAYMRMAAAAGIDVPETRMLGSTKREPGYFAARRFDRAGRTKHHVHSLAGLMHAPHTMPSMTYDGLLVATRRLTRDESSVREMFRRACFNVLAHNRDDHTRNFAFLMTEKGGWRAAPAYDLTYSSGPGGEHAMSILGAGRDPTRDDLAALAKRVGIKRADVVIDEVRAAVSKLAKHAQAAGVPKKVAAEVAKKVRVN